jgi:glycosyltransferase involved in cell wall biosynthesis/CDP-glycerol glycerophosphotransferase (TagB/SpsB family)
MTKKGLYKLVTKPHVFLKDYVVKKQRKFEYLIPKKKVIGEYQYTVVSAVYNVAPYLDDYFKSLVYQSLDFKKYIFLVLVDDGSPDNSADIIKKWQEKYPDNITYIKKENGGQASARNVGLKYVETEWVTFIDPDDFVDSKYFENIDNTLMSKNSIDVGMIGCKWVIYKEVNGSYSENHPLNFRFKRGNRVFEYKKDKKFLPSSVATTLYRISAIEKYCITFNEDIKPNFEDGYFSGRYLLFMDEKQVIYASGSKYFYRKRGGGTSTLDNSWNNPNRFDVVLKQGYLGLLKDNKNIPLAIQRLILYDIFWYFKKIINNPQSISFLTSEQKNEFKKLVYQVLVHIDRDTILDFELAGFWFYHKVGFLGMFDKGKMLFNIVYIEAYDDSKALLKLRYFYYGEIPIEEFEVDNTLQIPIYVKSRKHYFLDDVFCKERIVWLPIDIDDRHLLIKLNNSDTRITFNGKQYTDGIGIENIIELKTKPSKLNKDNLPIHIRGIRALAKSKNIANQYRDAYVIMDRDNQADDNAEHFYRYLKENHTELNIYFVLRENSHDYLRLKEEGFNLLIFDSLSHKLALLNAKHLISSHADKYVVDYLKPKYYADMIGYKFTFLQHGIIRDDISTWLNKKNIDLFVTSMPSEYDSIASEESNYKATPKEVVLTGLARHDRLISRSEPTEQVILIMPTWRNSLVGEMKGVSAERKTADEFYASQYAKYWKSVLHSPKLEEYATKYGYKVVFFPHVNMGMYIDWFDAPDWIEVRTHQTDPILHKLFRRAKIMITDYSSVFFELAILKKAILYYQFDFEYMYGGNHSSQVGYFDFEKDGFGPVSYDESRLFTQLETILDNDAIPQEIYLKRIEEAFPFRDGKNRERTLHAVQSLDKPLDKKLFNNKSIIESYLNRAIPNNRWKLVGRCLEILYNKEGLETKELLLLIKAKRLTFDYEDAEKYLDLTIKSSGITDELKEEQLRIPISKELWGDFLYQYKSYEERIEAQSDTVFVKELLQTLTEEEQNILINEQKDILTIFTYENILEWFEYREWNILNVATKLIDRRILSKKNLGYFYYICVVTANELENSKEALAYLPSVKDYL